MSYATGAPEGTETREQEQGRRLQEENRALQLVKEGLDRVPVPVIGVDPRGRIIFVNLAAGVLAPTGTWMIGADARDTLPPLLATGLMKGFRRVQVDSLFGRDWLVDVQPLGRDDARGALITLVPCDPGPTLAALDASRARA